MAVHESGAAEREKSTRDATTCFGDAEARDIPAAGGEGLTTPGHQVLSPAECGQAANKEFRLSFTAAIAAGQVEVRQWAAHRKGVKA
jgi:hypothetical protein